MNLKSAAALTLAVCLSTFAFDVQPAEAGPNINKRQKNQNQRIRRGMRNGSLNKREAKRLRKQQKAFNRREAKMRASGGKLTAKERAKLNRSQDKMSKNIFKQKNDNNFRNGSKAAKRDLHDINKSQANQNRRIRQGVKSGELTKKEATRLRNQQDKFAAREAKLREGGLTRKERVKLDKHQDKMSQNIYKQKNDKQSR